MRDFQNAFDAALAGVDSTIVEVMGLCAQFTSGAQCGSEVQGVFDDPESLGFAGSGVRIEGSCPSLFVRTDTVRAVRRGDTLTINGETFWVDRVSPDDGGSCYLWLNRGQPPAVNGPAVADEFDKPTTDIRKDRCSKCMRGCEMRGMVANFGGFLSINKLSQ